MKIDRLRRLTDELKPFRSLLIRHEEVLLFAQSQQSAASHAGTEHCRGQECRRWLLHMVISPAATS